MGNLICGMEEAKAANPLDEAYGTAQVFEGGVKNKDFVTALCERIHETDGEYKEEREESEPEPREHAISVMQFKRWATQTARCNPLWRIAETEVDTNLSLENFQKALSSDPQFKFIGYILMAQKLSEGDGELLQPHAKSFEHWFGWELQKSKDYFFEIASKAGKGADCEVLEVADIKAYCSSDDILLRHIEYCFGYTEWSEGQKCLVTKNKEPYVVLDIKQLEKAYGGKGDHALLGGLMQAYRRAIAQPGKSKEEVERGERYYFDQEPKPKGGAPSGGNGHAAATGGDDHSDGGGGGYPSLEKDEAKHDQPAAASHLAAPDAAADGAASDQGNEPSKSSSLYPQLGK